IEPGRAAIAAFNERQEEVNSIQDLEFTQFKRRKRQEGIVDEETLVILFNQEFAGVIDARRQEVRQLGEKAVRIGNESKARAEANAAREQRAYELRNGYRVESKETPEQEAARLKAAEAYKVQKRAAEPELIERDTFLQFQAEMFAQGIKNEDEIHDR